MADVKNDIPSFVLPDAEPPAFILPGGTDGASQKTVKDVPPRETSTDFFGEGEMPGAAKKTITSKGYEGYPTFAEFDPSQLPSQKKSDPIRNANLLFGYAFANGPQERADIIQKNIPEAEFSSDKYGNPLVMFNGEKYHIDKPTAFNLQNVANVGAQTAVGAPLAALAAAAPLGVAGSAALQGVAGAGTSALGDIIANVAGADQKVDYAKAGISGLIGAGGSALTGAAAKYLSPVASELKDVPNAVKNLFSGSAKETGIAGKQSGAYHSSDMMLHDPSFQGFAARIMSNEPQSPAARTIESALQSHAEQAPIRIASDVDTAFGPASVSERAASKSLLAAKKNLSPQLDTVLSGAQSVNPAGVVSQIDKALETAPKGSPTESLLRKARGMLIEKEGVPGVPNKIDPQSGLPIVGSGKPGTPPTYVTDPRTLENARLSLDRIIKFGDSSVGINPNAIAPQDFAITNVRTALSDTLKNQIPGYRKLMEKYSDIYALLDANEQGANIFAKGKDALRPDQVAAMAADPKTGAAFKNGARAAVANKLATSPDDLRALKGMVGGPGDYTRANIETLYGPKSVDVVQSAAQREATGNEVAKSLLSAKKAGEQSVGAKIYEQSTAPLEANPIQQAYKKFAQNPVNNFIDWARGRTGDAYSKGLGDFLTMPRNEGIKGLQSILQNKADVRSANKLAVPTLIAPAEVTAKRAGGSVGRIGRASGGKVGGNIKPLVDRLMRLADQAKKSTDNNTKPLLDAPDESIVKALRIANKAI